MFLHELFYIFRSVLLNLKKLSPFFVLIKIIPQRDGLIFFQVVSRTKIQCATFLPFMTLVTEFEMIEKIIQWVKSFQKFSYKCIAMNYYGGSLLKPQKGLN